MNKDLLKQIVDSAYKRLDGNTTSSFEYGFSSEEVERLIEDVVGRCICILEQEIDTARDHNNNDLYVALVNTALSIMNAFDIDTGTDIDDIDVDTLLKDLNVDKPSKSGDDTSSWLENFIMEMTSNQIREGYIRACQLFRNHARRYNQVHIDLVGAYERGELTETDFKIVDQIWKSFTVIDTRRPMYDWLD